jgi:hypothetical protein
MDTRENKAASGTPTLEWIDALVGTAHKIADAEGI